MTEFLLSRQYSVHSLNMNVATSILLSQHSFSAAFASWCHDQSFHVTTVMLICFFKLMSRPSFSYRDNISIMVLVATLSCIIVILVATQKASHNRVLLPLSLFSYCSFIFLSCDLDFCVGDVLHVATPICYVATTFFCMQHIFQSRLSSSGRDITCLPLACLCVATHFPCRDRTFLCSTDLCCHDLVFYVAT